MARIYKVKLLSTLGMPAKALAALLATHVVYQVDTIPNMAPDARAVAFCFNEHDAEMIASLLQKHHDLVHMGDGIDNLTR